MEISNGPSANKSKENFRLCPFLLDSLMHVVCQGYVEETFGSSKLSAGYLSFQQMMTEPPSDRALLPSPINHSSSCIKFDMNRMHLCYFKQASGSPWGVMKSSLLFSVPYRDIISIDPDTGNSFQPSPHNVKNNNTNTLLVPCEENLCVTFRQYSFKRDGDNAHSSVDEFELTIDDDDYIKSDSSKLFEEGFIQAPSKCSLIRSMTFGGRISKQDSPYYSSPSGTSAVIGNSKYHANANLITDKMRHTIIDSYATAKPIIGIDEFHVTLTFRCTQCGPSESSSSSCSRVNWIEALSRAKDLGQQFKKD